MRKILRLISIALFAGSIACATFSLAGCKRNGAKQLSLAVVSGVEGEALKQAALDYEALNGVHINIAEFPYDNLFEKELIDLSAGTGAYDLIMLDDPWFPRFASENRLASLAPAYQKRGLGGPDDDFVGSSLAVCKHPYENGDLLALPYVGNSQLFFYRKDLFEKYGLTEPSTWNDVLAAAKTIQEKETSADGGRMYGYVMRAAQGNAAVADFMPIFWAFGGEMFDANGKPTVNTPEGIAAEPRTLPVPSTAGRTRVAVPGLHSLRVAAGRLREGRFIPIVRPSLLEVRGTVGTVLPDARA